MHLGSRYLKKVPDRFVRDSVQQCEAKALLPMVWDLQNSNQLLLEYAL